MGFNPEKYKSEQQAEGAEDDKEGVVPQGKYLFAFVRVGHKRVGERQWLKANCQARVLWAPPECRQYEGKHFWIGFGLNYQGSPGQAALLSRICSAAGVTEEFDPEKLKELRRALLFMPMAAELKVSVQGRYKNQEWGKIIPRDVLNPDTLVNFDHWRKGLLEEFPNAFSDSWAHDGDPGPSDEDAPADGRWGDLPF